MPRSSPQTERIVLLMQLLADEPSMGRTLSDIARHLGVSKPTCYPMLVALTDLGWLLRDPGTKGYRLGPATISIGRAAESAMRPVEIARPFMRALADEIGLAAVAFVPSAADLAVAEIVQPSGGRRNTLGLRLGDTLEIAPPLGAGVAAWYEDDRLSEWYQLGGDRAGVDRQYLEELYGPALAVIRARGYAVECADQSEESLSDALVGLRGNIQAGQSAMLAVRQAQSRLPVDVVVGEIDSRVEYRPISINAAAFGPDGCPAMVLALVDARVAIPGDRVSEIGVAVRDAADAITRQLGGRSPRL